MKVYQGKGLGDFYYSLLRDITNHGREVTVRGHKCLELPEPVALVYTFPGSCWMNIPRRRFNPFFALAEVYWILSGMDSANWIGYYNKRMLSFRDGEYDGLHGAYGSRIRRWPIPEDPEKPPEVQRWVLDQISEVVKKLTEDSHSRQAVISLWDPMRDNLTRSNDYPCNNLVYYSLRDGVLDQTVVIRSNDVVWGTPYNAVQFSHLHALVAGNLKVKIGTFTYLIQNLHYYYNLYKETLASLLEEAFDVTPGVGIGTRGGPGALVIPNFDTVTEEELCLLGENIEDIEGGWGVNKDWKPLQIVHFRGSGYWNQTIPNVLWLYRIIKESSGENSVRLDQRTKEFLVQRILALGSPLVEMILDFFGGSEKELQKELVQMCQKQIQPIVK
jgi:thymidylate synthase